MAAPPAAPPSDGGTAASSSRGVGRSAALPPPCESGPEGELATAGGGEIEVDAAAPAAVPPPQPPPQPPQPPQPPPQRSLRRVSSVEVRAVEQGSLAAAVGGMSQDECAAIAARRAERAARRAERKKKKEGG